MCSCQKYNYVAVQKDVYVAVKRHVYIFRIFLGDSIFAYKRWFNFILCWSFRKFSTYYLLLFIYQDNFGIMFPICFIATITDARNTICSAGRDCRIHRLHLCSGIRPPLSPTNVLDMTLNNLMMRIQWCWGFEEWGATLQCHCSQVHSGLE